MEKFQGLSEFLDWPDSRRLSCGDKAGDKRDGGIGMKGLEIGFGFRFVGCCKQDLGA